MEVEEAVVRIKNAGHDISNEYATDRCIAFLNNSIQQIAGLLVTMRYPQIVQSTTLRTGDTLPKNFIRTAGTYPIRITNGKVDIVNDAENVTVRYFATPTLVETTKDKMPYEHDGINEIIVRGAILLALNENEYDITQDNALYNNLQQAIAGGIIDNFGSAGTQQQNA